MEESKYATRLKQLRRVCIHPLVEVLSNSSYSEAHGSIVHDLDRWGLAEAQRRVQQAYADAVAAYRSRNTPHPDVDVEGFSMHCSQRASSYFHGCAAALELFEEHGFTALRDRTKAQHE